MKSVLKEIIHYRKERGWMDQNPADVAKSVVIESAELLELFQWSAPTLKEIKKNPQLLKHLRHEIADVLIYLYSMCIDLGVDPDKIVQEKLIQVRKKYPAKLVKGNSANYLKLKKTHRKNRV